MWIPAQPLHFKRIVDLCQELYREDPAPRPVTADQTFRTLELFQKNPLRGAALVLEIEGEISGYALLASFWSNELGGEICTLDEFYVSPLYRGCGHGRALLKELAAQSGRLWPQGVKAFDLEVTPGNPRARKFYEEFGFKPAKNTHMRLRY